MSDKDFVTIESIEAIMKLMTTYKIDNIKICGVELTKTKHQEPAAEICAADVNKQVNKHLAEYFGSGVMDGL